MNGGGVALTGATLTGTGGLQGSIRTGLTLNVQDLNLTGNAMQWTPQTGLPSTTLLGTRMFMVAGSDLQLGHGVQSKQGMRFIGSGTLRPVGTVWLDAWEGDDCLIQPFIIQPTALTNYLTLHARGTERLAL